MKFAKKVDDNSDLTVLEKVIIDIVNQLQGCKLIDLIVEITRVIINSNRTNIEINNHFTEITEFEKLSASEKVNTLINIIINLINKNKLIGLHYKLDSGNYHEKMFILPKGSSFKYLNKKEISSND